MGDNRMRTDPNIRANAYRSNLVAGTGAEHNGSWPKTAMVPHGDASPRVNVAVILQADVFTELQIGTIDNGDVGVYRNAATGIRCQSGEQTATQTDAEMKREKTA